jgi:hypothetical protein
LVSAYLRHQTGIDITNGQLELELDYLAEQADDGSIHASVDHFNLALLDTVINTFSDGTGVDFSGIDQEILNLPEFRLKGGQLKWSEQTASLESISINKASISLSRDENNVFNMQPQRLDADTFEDDSSLMPGDETSQFPEVISEGQEQNSGGEWQITLNQFAINQLTLNLEDNSINPHPNLGVLDFNLTVNDISNQPGKEFLTNLSLQLKTGGLISMDGKLSVLPDPSFYFAINLDALNLAAAQPYVEQLVNLNLDSGEIHLKGQISNPDTNPFLFKGDVSVRNLNKEESVDGKKLGGWKNFEIV